MCCFSFANEQYNKNNFVWEKTKKATVITRDMELYVIVAFFYCCYMLLIVTEILIMEIDCYGRIFILHF